MEFKIQIFKAWKVMELSQVLENLELPVFATFIPISRFIRFLFDFTTIKQ